MPTPNVTLEGRLIEDASLKFTSSGKGVCNLRVACNDPKKENGDYGDSLIVGVAVWNTQYEPQAAESCAELLKGQRVVVTGRLYQRPYESNGEKRTALEVKFARVAVVVKGGQQQQANTGWNGSQRGGQQADPWGSARDASEPPF